MPFAIVATLVLGVVGTFIASVAAIRYFSKPPGRTKLLKYWKTFTSYSFVQKILYQ